MILDRKASKCTIRGFLLGVFLSTLVVAGGVSILLDQQNNSLLTADISQVVELDFGMQDTTDEVFPHVEQELSKSTQPQSNTISLALQKAKVFSSVVSPGGEVTILADIPDTSDFVLFMDVYIESTNSDQTLKGSIVNINGEGKMFGAIVIPIDATQGIWVIKKISIVDTTDSPKYYNDGEDMSATFTVTAL